MRKKYGDLLDNINQTLGQAGAMKEHFEEAIADLEMQKKALKDKKHFKKAKRDLKRANNAGRRVTQYFDRVKNDINKAKQDEALPLEIRQQLAGFEQTIKPHEAALTAKTSYFIGQIGDDVNSCGIQLDLLAKQKQTEQMVLNSLEELIKKIRGIIADDLNNIGLVSFMVEIKNKLLPMATKNSTVPSR